MSLSFLPRNLIPRSRPKPPHHAHTPQANNSIANPESSEPTPKTTALSDADHVALVALLLSDYALFIDSRKRRCIEESEDGYIPLLSIMNEYSPQETEATVSKALRTLAPHAIDVRLVFNVVSPTDQNSPSMYSVRRQHRDPAVQAYTHREWTDRTVYIENCPSQYTSKQGIFALVNALISYPSAPNPATGRVQAVSFIRHHLDQEGDIPKPKPFAFVTLQQLADVQKLLSDWPWKTTTDAHTAGSKRAREHDGDIIARTKKSKTASGKAVESTSHPAVVDVDAAGFANVARKFGFRTLSKRRWETLKQEYLNYRANLVQEMSILPELNPLHPPPQSTPAIVPQAEDDDPISIPRVNEYSHFPPNCLVYVQNVHMGTSKTALKTLFSNILDNSFGIDYVDYNKGMHTCHLRLTEPRHALQLVSSLKSCHTTQESGLDDVGRQSAPSEAYIKAEVVTGKPEALYWEKVPLRVRQNAVAKALSTGPEHTKKDSTRRSKKTKGQGR